MDISIIFDKLVAPLRRRVRLMISRAVLAAVNDAGGIQLVQVKLLEGEVRDGVERLQNYGFTSVPKVGAEGLMACVSGDRDHGIIVAMDDRRFRLKSLQPGEVAMYSDEGDTIIFKRGRTIEATAGAKVKAVAPQVEVVASIKVLMTTPLVEMSQDLKVLGNVEATGSVSAGGNISSTGGNITDSSGTSMANMRSVYNAHTHSDPQGGSVGTPSGTM